MTFFSQLTKRILDINSLLCVGLDPHPQDIASSSEKGVREFCYRLIESTTDSAAAYKPNIAFFEALGTDGTSILQDVLGFIPDDIPVILDAKRGDISSTAKAYAHAAFDVLGVDAITLNPYLGYDSISPFIEYPDKGAFLLCKTSNPGAGDVQDTLVGKIQGDNKDIPLFIHIARLANSWNKEDNLGLVVGATKPESLASVRSVAPDLWILSPGIGAQGGDLRLALQSGQRSDGLGILIPISRSISRSKNPRDAALEFRDLINRDRVFPSKTTFTVEKPVISGSIKRVADGLLDAGCIKFGDFTLKSGTKSPFYIDLRRLTGYPGLLSLIAKEYIRILDGLEFDHLAALPYAALPIATSISLLADWSMIYPRKESKEYGTKAQVEGVFKLGDKVVVIDDLITTGESKVEGIKKLEAKGLRAQEVVVLIDRSVDGCHALEEQGLKVHAVIDLTQILEYYANHGKISSQMLSDISDFLEDQRNVI